MFKILVSNSNVKKSVNIFLSLFVFLYTVLPIENIISDFKLNIENDYELSSYDEIYKNGYETIIIKSIESICVKNDVTLQNINIDSYIDENHYLVVNRIEIELSNDEKNHIIQDELKEKFNFEVIFI